MSRYASTKPRYFDNALGSASGHGQYTGVSLTTKMTCQQPSAGFRGFKLECDVTRWARGIRCDEPLRADGAHCQPPLYARYPARSRRSANRRSAPD